jgi:hypothetical protein
MMERSRRASGQRDEPDGGDGFVDCVQKKGRSSAGGARAEVCFGRSSIASFYCRLAEGIKSGRSARGREER